jgi:group I intron endonuclease
MIYRALLKYSYSNFSFEILEYCVPVKCNEKEQHFIDLLKPVYNILQIAGSRLGSKHSEGTIRKFKARSLIPEQKKKAFRKYKRTFKNFSR